jgi:hypothetical protein
MAAETFDGINWFAQTGDESSAWPSESKYLVSANDSRVAAQGKLHLMWHGLTRRPCLTCIIQTVGSSQEPLNDQLMIESD